MACLCRRGATWVHASSLVSKSIIQLDWRVRGKFKWWEGRRESQWCFEERSKGNLESRSELDSAYQDSSRLDSNHHQSIADTHRRCSIRESKFEQVSRGESASSIKGPHCKVQWADSATPRVPNELASWVSTWSLRWERYLQAATRGVSYWTETCRQAHEMCDPHGHKEQSKCDLGFEDPLVILNDEHQCWVKFELCFVETTLHLHSSITTLVSTLRGI